MDFQSFKRRDLQALCKLNKLPANTTNAAMADSLASLPTVEGLEEFLENLDSEHQGSPERSVIPKSNGRRTTTRQKAVKEELECSNLGTKSTRLRTRTKAVEETDTRTRTRTTRTTRNRASQESSIPKMDIDLQAEFEAGMEQSQISENNVLPEVEHQDIPEEASGVSVENEGQLLSKCQGVAQNAVDDGQEIVDVDNGENNKEEDHIVNDMQTEDSELLNESKIEVDYHTLSRKDLQNLCKKNKIPANMTNAAMADALQSLEVVEGLQEFVKGSDSQALSSPVAGINSSCARRSRTTQKVTKEEPRSSKLITKSCRGSRRRIIEETNQGKDDVPKTPAAPTTRGEAARAGSALYEIQEKENSAVHKSELKKMENLNMETSEVSGVAEFNADMCNSLMKETSPVTESTLEDDNGKVNIDLPSVENSKEPKELVSQVGENVVEEVLESAEVDIRPEVVTSCVDDYELGVQQSKNVEIDADNEAEGGQLENLDNFNADDQTSKEVVSEFSTQADEPSLENMVQSESEGDESKLLFSNTQSDKPSMEPNMHSESVGGFTEDEMLEKSDSDATSQDGHFSMEVNVESESEVTDIEDNEMSEKFGFKAISQDVRVMEVNVASESEEGNTENEAAIDDQASLEINVEVNATSKSEEGNTEAAIDDQASLETNVVSEEGNTEAATDSCWFEKPEECNAEDVTFNKFNLEATIPATNNSCSLTETELYEVKSLRQLKMLYKEKLQEAKLAKKMENLTLKETEIPMAKVEEDLHECLVESEIVSSPSVVVGLSENDQVSSIVVPQTIHEDEAIEDDAEESEEKTRIETSKLFPVDILLDNEVASENAITGNINVVTSAPQSTPSKCSSNTKKSLLSTQSKSSSKPQVSVGTKGVLVDNKENIDSSVSKSGPGKIKFAVTESIEIVSPLSMAKLKRDYKFLKQQSETKKQALQSRSGNLLASPN